MADTSGPLYWNPGAISYLVELLLALMLSAYIVHRLIREHRGDGISAPTMLMGITFGFFVPSLYVSLLHALTGGGWTSYAMPWLPPSSFHVLAMPWVTTLAGVSAIAFVQLAYRFPQRLPGTERESALVGSAMMLCICAEFVTSAYTDWTLLQGQVWFRPDWAAAWTSASMLWAVVLFVRQLVRAQVQPAGEGALPTVRALFGPAANREARAARGFLIFSLLPLAHTGALVVQGDGLLGAMSMDILLSWSALAQLTGLTLVFFGYLPERSSFLFKLTTICVVLLFAAILGACWVLSPTYIAQFRAPAMPQALTAIQFTPQPGGGYAVGQTSFAPAPSDGTAVGAEGARVALPFALPFYRSTYQTAHVAGDGSVGFLGVPSPVDVTIHYGARPAVHPLLVRRPETGSRVTVRAEQGRLVVTRRDRCPALATRDCLAFQTVLQADGRIVVHYLAVPAAPRFQLFDPLAAPWLSGITPGISAPGAVPVMRDHYRAFLAHLDRLYASVVPFTIVIMLAVLLVVPLLLQGFLVRPLNHLLRGMRRFRDGDLSMQVAVTFNDEIGYLTDSFNAMASAQHGLVNTLEEQVAERSAQLAEFAARNARLEERNRLSGDLHDTVTQTLFSAAMLSEGLAHQWHRDPDAGAERLAQVEQMNRHALAEMRMMLTELRNEGIVEQPLAQLVTALAQEFTAAHAGRAQVQCDIRGDTVLPLDVQAMMYRIAQESLNNIAHHAAATRIEIVLDALPGQAMLSISDNGQGFDPCHVPGGHLGLEIMRERARRIDAVLEIETSPGAGTRVTAIWMQPA